MSDTANNLLHILRNPHGWSDDAVRAVRLAAADEIERLRKDLEYANLAAEAEARRVDELKTELDALKKRKPVAWAMGGAVTQSEAEAARWEHKGMKVAPLYAAPKPGEPT